MRSFTEARTRWEVTARHGSSIADLQRAVKFNGPDSPCVAGLRSVCWKMFLLFPGAPQDSWMHVLGESRSAYAALRERYLKYIKHPELLAGLSADPLADDPESPWNAVRLDDVMRAEILQDVQRLPDEPLYRNAGTQTLILDILFVYCKMNPDVGGYRQGMHELLAPFVYVLHGDALDRSEALSAAVGAGDFPDAALAEMCDSSFIEHDAFTLFSRLMAHAKPFYEVGDQGGLRAEPNTIVEKSKQIHEVALRKVDPELSSHLTNIEVLPQIFLIRWIRLLFSREFPLVRLLVLWDTIFAFDPALDQIDLVCVAMLLRIRWTLLEADYSSALQLLLKYPDPDSPHGPHTFVDDALYLRDHLHAAGGANLILKYSGKSPALSQPTSPRPSTPSSGAGALPPQGLALRQRTLGPRSSLRPLSQAGGVEALFQGAAKGVLERGEKLGINQAVREAMGEIRRNVQGLQNSAARNSPSSSGAGSVALMERRNRQLGAMLEETVGSLKILAASGLEEKDRAVEAIELAAAKMQFIQVYLEDSSLAIPSSSQTTTAVSYRDSIAPTVALDTTEITTTTAVEGAMAALALPSSPSPASGDQPLLPKRPPVVQSSPTPTPKSRAPPDAEDHDYDRMDTDDPAPRSTLDANEEVNVTTAAEHTPLNLEPPSSTTTSTTTASAASAAPQRPKAPIPTRSTLAQSSFAWMLEPDAGTSNSPPRTPFPPPPGDQQRQQQQDQQRRQPQPAGSSRQGSVLSSSSSSSQQPQQQRTHKRKSGNASREKNAFLFGEVTAEGEDPAGGGLSLLSADQIFGLQPIRKR